VGYGDDSDPIWKELVGDRIAVKAIEETPADLRLQMRRAWPLRPNRRSFQDDVEPTIDLLQELIPQA